MLAHRMAKNNIYIYIYMLVFFRQLCYFCCYFYYYYYCFLLLWLLLLLLLLLLPALRRLIKKLCWFLHTEAIVAATRRGGAHHIPHHRGWSVEPKRCYLIWSPQEPTPATTTTTTIDFLMFSSILKDLGGTPGDIQRHPHRGHPGGDDKEFWKLWGCAGLDLITCMLGIVRADTLTFKLVFPGGLRPPQ